MLSKTIPPAPALAPGFTPKWAAGGSGDWAAPALCFTLQMAGTSREGQLLLWTTGSRLGYQLELSFCQQKQSWLGWLRKHKKTHSSSWPAAWHSIGLSLWISHASTPGTAERSSSWDAEGKGSQKMDWNQKHHLGTEMPHILGGLTKEKFHRWR